MNIGDLDITYFAVGDTQALKVCLGAEQVWPEGDPGYSSQYLTFEILSAGTVVWKVSTRYLLDAREISYSINNGAWTNITATTAGTSFAVSAGDIVKFKGNNDFYAYDFYESHNFGSSTAVFKCYGNIMSLIYGDNFLGKKTFPTESYSNFSRMFQGCTGLTTAINLVMPVTALTWFCYGYMFQGCTNLVAGPTLPAVDFNGQRECYESMFSDCNSLFYIKCLLEDARNIEDCLKNWVMYTPMTGAFVRKSNASGWAWGSDNGIPTGWRDVTDGQLYIGEVGYRVSGASTTYRSMQFVYGEDSAFTYTTDPTVFTSGSNIVVYASEDNSGGYLPVLYPGASVPAYEAHMTLEGYMEGFNIVYNPDYGLYELVPIYMSIVYSAMPLTFEVLSGGTIFWKASKTAFTAEIEYKKNDGEWTSITATTAGTEINVVAGDKVQFRGDNQAYSIYSQGIRENSFSGTTCVYKVYGNIMSLVNSTGFTGATTLQSAYTFYSLFYTNTGLTDASNLILPATSLTEKCYSGMFRGCSSLETAPVLPATAISSNCYEFMFMSCGSLTTAPELPASTLPFSCYQNMFTSCVNLNYVKCLATDLSGYNCLNQWLSNVAQTGTFVKHPNMTSWASGDSGIPTGWTVQDAVI